MLQLKNIKKDYITGDATVHALKGIDLCFRKSEFVSVLGQSGCGKTTLLNIIGGLDRYTSGDLIINGRSTEDFSDAEWDTYRNHSVGFVFQSYNLIPHQTVLSNVELALTLSGVSKSERRKRAVEALRKVGLGDQLSKKPNQMSGGQMQRVAIARALVNDPDILLADEPTGALDSETSVQIMELLKTIASNRLVIMVTHNPELAERYSTRIIRLLDGKIVSDSDPYDNEDERKPRPKVKKTSMSFFTALSLSFNNLMTKKARTLLTGFAGSIGIIGIALVLSVSSGVNAYIKSVEESTMSSYPVTVTETAMDMSSMVDAFLSAGKQTEATEDGRIYSNDAMIDMMKTSTEGFTSNDLKKFRRFIEGNTEFKSLCSDIKYIYTSGLNTYLTVNGESGTEYRKSLDNYMELFGNRSASDSMNQQQSSVLSMSTAAWRELVGDEDTVRSQYTVVDGRLPENGNEIVLMVNSKNGISDFVLYMLGIRDPQEITDYLEAAAKSLETGEENPVKIDPTSYTYDELYNLEFSILSDSDYYDYDESTGKIVLCDEERLNEKLKDAKKLKIVGIVRPADDSMASSSAGGIGYLGSLTSSLIESQNNSEVVRRQLEEDKIDLTTGMPFNDEPYTAEALPTLRAMLGASPEYSAYATVLSDEQLLKYANENLLSTKEDLLEKLGYVDVEKPNAIYIYPKDFESKDRITEIIKEYNSSRDKADQITYTDTVGMLIKSVTTIIDVISYVLVGFVAISLVVSSIMIGIITYISVLERTKEIGILRAIGASKRDISRVFNAETLTVGFVAGVIGIGITLLLILAVNAVLHSLTGISTLNAILSPTAAVVLIAVSMFLTFIAGLIPSGIAARKDPVRALTSE